MKKSLSLLVAIAMVFSMFATVASADTQSNYDILFEAGIFKGYPDGSAGLDKEMTRAEYAAVIARVTGVSSDDVADFIDIPADHWAGKDINAVVEAGYLQGVGGGKFDPAGKVTLEQMIAIAVRLLGLEVDEEATVDGKVSAWAQAEVAAALNAGIIQPLSDYTANATRGDLVDITIIAYEYFSVAVAGVEVIDAKNIVVTFTDGGEVEVALEEALQPGANTITVTYNDREYTVDVNFEGLAISKVEQTNTGEITVTFNRVVDAAEKKDLTFEVKSNDISYTITQEWSEDNKAAILSSNYLPEGVYEVTVGDFDPVSVTIVDERAAKIEITATTLQKTDGQDLGIKLYNQFGKEIENPSLDVRVYNATKGEEITDDDNDGKYDLADDDVAEVDDTVVVTATHASGVSASKTFKVVAGSAATKITLGNIKPLEDKSRITAGDEGLVLPYEMIDQYGSKINLPETAWTELDEDENKFEIGGITFILSAEGVVAAYEVDEDGVLKLDFANAGTLTINAVNPATGATASTVVKIDGQATIKTFQMSKPGSLVVANEEVKIPYKAVDSYGDEVAAKNIKIARDDDPEADELEIRSTVDFAAGYPKINGKGELIFKFESSDKDKTAFIYAYVDNVQVGKLEGLTVKKDAEKVKINGVKDVPRYFTKDATAKFDQDNITYLDKYNRTKNVAAGEFTVESSDEDVVRYVNGNLEAVGVGKAEITVNFTDGDDDTDYKFNVQVVKDDDVKSYEIKSIDTLYGHEDHDAASKYAKTVELIGKLSNGNEVAIVQDNAFDFVTTSDAAVVNVTGKKIFGVGEGEATIAAYKGGTKLDELVVKVSEAKPVATTVTIELDNEEVAEGTTLTFAINDDDADIVITVKDQYGVELDNVSGFLVSSDSDLVSVDNNAGTVTAEDFGQVTLTFITSNNVQGSVTIVVNE